MIIQRTGRPRKNPIILAPVAVRMLPTSNPSKSRDDWSVSMCCLLLFVAFLGCSSANLFCYGLSTPGKTFPEGDIAIEKGNPLEIYCLLNLSHPYFQNGGDSRNIEFATRGNPVDRQYVHIVNKTAARLYIEDPNVQSNVYQCTLKGPDNSSTGVCINYVAVGYKPLPVENFTCISKNWESLVCTWDEPYNPVKTLYRPYFYLMGRSARRTRSYCGLIKNRSCTWDFLTDPIYRIPYEFYGFNITANNSLGQATFKLPDFHHYGHVIPNKPEHLNCTHRTPYSIALSWTIPFPMFNFPPGILQKIMYRSQVNHTWETLKLDFRNQPSKRNMTYNVTNLPHANMLYDFRIQLRSSAATGDDKWSEPATLAIKTLPTIPLRPPRTNIGSFQYEPLPEPMVYVYWQQISEFEENGDDFQYKVTAVFSDTKELEDITPIAKTKSYALFKIPNPTDYTFYIKSVNEEGPSVESSVVTVPYLAARGPGEPQKFQKISYSENFYGVQWQPPLPSNKPESEVDTYTIFWCEHKRSRPEQCVGYLNWTTVPAHVRQYNITLPDNSNYQFAISANSKAASSGMVWAACTIIPNQVTSKVKDVWFENIRNTSITLAFRLDCPDANSDDQQFIVYYCPIVDPKNTSCKEENEEFVFTPRRIGDKLAVNVIDLKPYTTYNVHVARKTSKGPAGKSEVSLVTTLEGAPSPPWGVHIVNITNTSVAVEWKRPNITNGKLTNFKISLENSDPNCTPNATDLQRFVISNLTSFTNYSIKIAACTCPDCCSEYTKPVKFTTDIGVPGVMSRPVVEYGDRGNMSRVTVSWSRPDKPGGHIFQYQIKMHSKNEVDKSVKLLAFNGTEHKTVVNIGCIENEYKPFELAIRAVNNISETELLYGPWSKTASVVCSVISPHPWLYVTISLSIVATLLLVALVGWYFGPRIWDWWIRMLALEAKLPPQLEKGKDANCHLSTNWKIDDHRQIPRHACTDVELLLEQKDRNLSGDSSGCSSGHESVSSSLTSGTQCPSDSGTEVDQRPASPDMVFDDPSSAWDSSRSLAGTDHKFEKTPTFGSPNVPVNSYSILASVPGVDYIGITNHDGFSALPNTDTAYCQVGTDLSDKQYVSLPTSPILRGYVPYPKEPMTIPASKLDDSPSDSDDEPKSYCFVGLRTPPPQVEVPSKPKPPAGYTTLAELPQLQTTASGYVSHKQFEKKDAPPAPSLNVMISPSEDPCIKVSSNTSDCMKNSPTSV